MACKLIYKNKEFNSEQEVKDFITEELDNQFLQTEEIPVSKASAKTIELLKEFLNRIGVNYKQFTHDNNINGLADPMKGLIQVAEGKEDIALNEETMHMAVAIVKQTDPALYKEMFNKISEYRLFGQVLNSTYAEIYKTKEGKVDILRLKEEAIGKLLAEMVIQKNEGLTERPELLEKAQTWWQKVINFLKGLFNKAEFNPFEALATKVVEGENIGSVEDIKEGEVSYQLTNDLYNKLVDGHSKISKEEENGNSHYIINGKRIKNRVTDLAKKFYEKTFGKNQISKSEEQEAINDFKKNKGTAGHKDLENIFHRYIDDNGVRREQPLPFTGVSYIDPNNNAYYEQLEKNFIERLDTYPEGTRFLSELQVYNAAKDEAGTIDFLSILPNGKVDILDWKFMDINPSQTDVPWYKKEAFNIQIGEYKNILKNVYGLKDSDFRQTRAIPIITAYKWKAGAVGKELELYGIQIGSVDVKKIEDLRLAPVSAKGETTGDLKVDQLIGKLGALYEKLKEKPAEEGRRDIKKEQLNDLESSIRRLQVQGATENLIQSATTVISNVKGEIDRYQKQLDTATGKDTRKSLLNHIFEDADILEIFKDIDRLFKGTIEDKETLAKLKTVSDNAKDALDEIATMRDILGEELALGYNIKNLLDPEHIVNFLKRNFRSLSQAATASTKVLAKMVQKMAAAIDIEFTERTRELKTMKAAIDELAKQRGKSTREILSSILSKDKQGQWSGNLIRKIAPEFYQKLKDAQEKQDKDFIKENIDVEKYEEWYKKRIEDFTRYQANQIYDFDDEQANEKERKRRVSDFINRYDLSKTAAYSTINDQLSRFPKEEKWHSPEYKDLLQPANRPLLDFYNYWQSTMKEAYETGMLQGLSYMRFVPNVHKSLLEKSFQGLGKGFIKEIAGGLKSSPELVTVDPLTNKPVDKIAVNYINQLEAEDKSDDLFRVMALWQEEMLKFKYRSEIEGEVRLLSQIEHNKKAIVKNKKGTLSEVANDKNAEYFDNFMQAAIYGKRYAEGGDLTRTIRPNEYIDKINDFFYKYGGFKPLPRSNEDQITISATKAVESMNRWFQLKTLGFNVSTALSNLIGGTANAYISAGKFFTKGDLFEGETALASAKFHSTEGKIFAGLIEYFVPLTEDEKRTKARQLSVHGAVRNLSSDWMFYLQRESDRFVQLPILYAFAKNTMVENGELVNIREYVKNQNNYSSIYQLSPSERKELNDKIEKEVQELQKTRSLLKTSKIEKDELHIPGIERKSDTVYNFRNKVQQFSKDVLGNMDQNDIYQYRMNILMKSVMMFKNWIPRLVDVRFGELRENVGTDSYEWGRVNMLFNGLWHNLLNGTKSAIGIASGTESLIERAKKLYIQKQTQFGEDFMTEADFVDMYTRGIKQEIRELAILTAMLGILFYARAAVPPDADPEVKGAYRWGLRLLDKFSDELAFFYSPTSLIDVANGSLFPALGTLRDLQKFAFNGIKEGIFTITGNDKAADKNKVAKYLFKALPLTKELQYYLTIFDHELGQEYGVQIQSQYQAR